MSVLYHTHFYRLCHYMPFVATFQIDIPRKPPHNLFEHENIQKFNFGKTERGRHIFTLN